MVTIVNRNKSANLLLRYLKHQKDSHVSLIYNQIETIIAFYLYGQLH